MSTLSFPASRASSWGTTTTEAASQIWGLCSSGVRAAAHPGSLRWRWALVVLWVAGVAGDAYTTLAMMGTGAFEEANSLASAGMGVVGPAWYTAGASVVCLAMGLTTLGKPSGLFGKLVFALLLVAGVLKFLTAASNATLWLSV